jgi:thymidine kinase
MEHVKNYYSKFLKVLEIPTMRHILYFCICICEMYIISKYPVLAFPAIFINGIVSEYFIKNAYIKKVAWSAVKFAPSKKNKYNGKIVLIFGPMFSGKTSLLQSKYLRYKYTGKTRTLVKYGEDDRYDKDYIVNHDGIKSPCIKSLTLAEIEKDIQDFEVICIDEIQFYPDAVEYCEKWANEGRIVIACGLTGTFQREPFPVITELVPKAEEIIHAQAICESTGENASFTIRLSKETGVKVIGGADKYKATDRITYYAIKEKLEKCEKVDEAVDEDIEGVTTEVIEDVEGVTTEVIEDVESTEVK